ncbi:hypothetical protein K7432_011722 [Basidiobolus ranarum]|uniref:Uncharacterized protein n=1 Tax=Basidiobolus ranarum TaxID=34480 RepID=A0ABR2VU60_9FUNG
MFKNWKKKSSSTKSDSSERRFSLLGSKTSQSPVSGGSPDLRPFAYSKDDSGYQRKDSQTSTLLSAPSMVSLNSQTSSILEPGATSTLYPEEVQSTQSFHNPHAITKPVNNHTNDLPIPMIKEPTVLPKVSKERREVPSIQYEEASIDLQADENVMLVYRLDSRVQKLQKQVKDMRQYFKGLLKRDTEELVTASIKIQALARGYLTRKEYRDYKFVKLRGLHITRKLMTRCQLQKECSRIGGFTTEGGTDTEQDLAAVKIQRAWRGQMVRTRVGQHKRIEGAATRIQSLWRGYRTREANPRLMVKILRKRSKEQQKTIQRLTRDVKTLQIQMDEEIMIQKEHTDSLSYLHTEVRALKAEKAISPKKSPVAVRKPRLSSGPPAVDFSKFVTQEDFTYLKAEIEFLHQRLEELSSNANSANTKNS